jgi:surfeit locus 1 family protein
VKERPLYRQSRWVLGHFIILILVIVMANLGFWQLRRLHETQHHNAEVRAHINGSPVPVTQQNIRTLPAYQRVSVNGSWDAPDTYLLRYPIHLGQQGYWVIEPVFLNAGGVVYVNRGWIPQSQGQAMTKPAADDGGSVQIVGLVQRAQTEHDPVDTNGAHPAVRTQTAITQPWVQLVSPASKDDPVPLDPPDLSNGSHFSYFLQWLSFCVIAVAGWVSVLVKATREASAPAAVGAAMRPDSAGSELEPRQ